MNVKTGAYVHFEIVSSTSSAAESALTPTISLRMLPSAPHSTPLDGCVRSIAHMQFCLDGHGHANRGTAGQLPSIQENVAGARPRLGRSKGSLGSIPISILTYGWGAAENETVHNAVGRKHEEGVEGAVGIEVTVLIGGQPVGARSPLSYTDILKMVESTTIPPSSASSTSMHPRNASVHSLGISGSRLLCVHSSSSHPGGSIVLSGPSELFEGGGLDGINGIVAQVICSTFTALQIGGRKNNVNARKVNGAVRRRTSDEAKGYRYGTYTNDEEEEGSDDVLTSAALVAQTVALMLIIQSEVRQPS